MRRIAFSVGTTFILILGVVPCGYAGDVKLLVPPSTFPLTISTPGSYRLKKNFTVPDASTTAIVVNTSNVTLDLNGYTVSGPTVCPGPPSPCAPAGSADGIVSGFSNVAILNGTVQGFGSDGIALSQHSRVERVRTSNNGGSGINVGEASVVTDNQTLYNGDGINAANGCTITGNVSAYNLGVGIFAGGGSSVTGNTVQNNNGTYALSLSNASAGYAGNVIGAVVNTVNGGTDLGHNLCNTSTICP